MEDNPEVPIRATKTAFELLEALQDLDGAGTTELAQHLDMAKSTVHDHLNSLERTGYVVKTNGTYRIGLGLLEFGGYARRQKRIYAAARPEIRSLADQTGEIASLQVTENGLGMYVTTLRGEQAVEISIHTGTYVPLTTTAGGKAILAELAPDRVESIIDEHGLPERTEHTITERRELLSDLEEIRNQGYAVDNQESFEGIRCIAASVTTKSGDPLGAVSVAGPKNRLHGEYLTDDLPRIVLRTANVIELNVIHS